MFPKTQTASHSEVLVLNIEFAGHLGRGYRSAPLRCIDAACRKIAITSIDPFSGFYMPLFLCRRILQPLRSSVSQWHFDLDHIHSSPQTQKRYVTHGDM
jgi:hypothetical protein